MATYFATWGFPHDKRKKPTLIYGPADDRETQRRFIQEVAHSKTHPDFARIDLVNSNRGVTKRKRFEKGAITPRASAPTPGEAPPAETDPPAETEE